jgi:hypothetical protein
MEVYTWQGVISNAADDVCASPYIVILSEVGCLAARSTRVVKDARTSSPGSDASRNSRYPLRVCAKQPRRGDKY